MVLLLNYIYKKYPLTLLIALLITGFSSPTLLQAKTIEGIVSDFSSQEKLVSASIYVVETNQDIYTDQKGHYTLSLPSTGSYTLRFSYVGYDTQEIKISEESSTLLNIRLKPNVVLKEIVVFSRKDDINITALSMGVDRLSMKQIQAIPALMGEVDVIKAIQLLPGVQATSEGGSGFSVRGGSPDQNLIVLDNTTVYNPSHLMGFFSIFNNDVISGVELQEVK